MDATAAASEKTQRSVTTGDLDNHNNSGNVQIISKCDNKTNYMMPVIYFTDFI